MSTPVVVICYLPQETNTLQLLTVPGYSVCESAMQGPALEFGASFAPTAVEQSAGSEIKPEAAVLRDEW